MRSHKAAYAAKNAAFGDFTRKARTSTLIKKAVNDSVTECKKRRRSLGSALKAFLERSTK